MLVDDIISSHLVEGVVLPEHLVTVRVDHIYIQDGNSPTIARLFAQHRLGGVFDRAKISVFFDHSVIWPNAEIASRIREAEEFCSRFGLQVFRAGEGISHVVAMEQGVFTPGSIVIGTDSHTCTGGAIQSLALGMGATDVVVAMLTGETWLKCPRTVVLKTVGTPGITTRVKDVVLYVLSTFGQLPFLYRAIEWTGPWAEALSMDSAETLSNMAVEMGAKCAFLPPQRGREQGMLPLSRPCGGEEVDILEINIAGLPPYIARPHSPANAVPLDGCAGLKINYVFVGSCTNSRLEDIEEVAVVLKGQKIHPNVHMLITPGSKAVYLDALRRGYIETFLQAGAIVTPPGCGSCLGTQGSIPAAGDRVLSTMNRNFLGRMGNKDADIYLSSPLVAANAAIHGRIPAQNELVFQ